MDTIYAYLDTMFSHLPKSKKVLQAKEELLQMMEDKYHSLKDEGLTEHEVIGKVITEFGDFEELKESLGLKEYDKQVLYEEQSDSQSIYLNKGEIELFIDAYQLSGIKISLGVMIIILGIIPLVSSSFLIDEGILPENITATIGIIILLASVIWAIYIFIVSDSYIKKYQDIKNKTVMLDKYIKSELTSELRDFESHYTIRIGVAVIMCIVAVFPIIISGSLFEDNNYAMAFSMTFLFLLVAVAVSQFIQLSYKKGSYDILLNRGDYSINEKKKNKLTKKISSPYWSIVLILYFLLSIKIGWGISWVIWPIAGIFFSAIASIIVGFKN